MQGGHARARPTCLTPCGGLFVWRRLSAICHPPSAITCPNPLSSNSLICKANPYILSASSGWKTGVQLP